MASGFFVIFRKVFAALDVYSSSKAHTKPGHGFKASSGLGGALGAFPLGSLCHSQGPVTPLSEIFHDRPPSLAFHLEGFFRTSRFSLDLGLPDSRAMRKYIPVVEAS